MPRVFLPAVLSGLLLWAAFFPLDLGALGFVALVPWLTLVRADVSRRRRYAAAYVGGFVFSALATQWVRVAHPMMYASWAAFAVVLPLFWVLALALIRRLDRLGLPLALSVPVVWVALEYMRMHFPTGYPFLKPLGLYQMIGFGWYFLGYTQHNFTQLIQIADLGGVYAVSFVVAAVNGMVADWVLRIGPARRLLRHSTPASPPVRVWRMALVSVAVLLLVAGSVLYGVQQKAITSNHQTPGPWVIAIQGSVPQFEKNAKGDSLAKTYADLHFLKALPHRPDLIVWPETCFPDEWFEVAPGQVAPMKFAQEVTECEKWFKTHSFGGTTLLGLNGRVWEDGREWKYNSALLIDPRGTNLGRYDKMHLVPFGEYVPLKETFPWMRTFTPYTHDYSCKPGESWTRFPLTTTDGRSFTFACLICYEDSDPYLARQYVAEQPVDFLVNISNDGWFDGTEEHEQHLAICRFRAIETRRSVVRAVNMGISAVIDSYGRVVALPGPDRSAGPDATWSGSKKVEGVVTFRVSIDDRRSWYARYGDWLPAACWSAILAGIVASRFRRTQVSTV